MFNQTLAQCTADLLAAYPALAPLSAPYFTYNPVTELIDLIVETKFITEGIELFINYPMYQFLVGFEFKYLFDPIKSYKIELFAYPNYENGHTLYGTVASTPPAWLRIPPQFSPIPYWGEMQQIVFRTTLIPIRPEYTSRPENAGLVGDPILTDYVITNWNGSRDNITFVENGVYRYIDLVSQGKVDKIQMEVFWKDRNGVLRPMNLYLGDFTANIKLAFVKENLVS
jgi:hypothetical protein